MKKNREISSCVQYMSINDGMQAEHEPILYGLYGERIDEHGQLRTSSVNVELDVRTNDTQENVLKLVDQAHQMMAEQVVKNFEYTHHIARREIKAFNAESDSASYKNSA